MGFWRNVVYLPTENEGSKILSYSLYTGMTVEVEMIKRDQALPEVIFG